MHRQYGLKKYSTFRFENRPSNRTFRVTLDSEGAWRLDAAAPPWPCSYNGPNSWLTPMPPQNRIITSPSRWYAITAAPAERARPAPPTSFPLRLRALQGSVACGGRRSRPWWARRTERGLSTSWLLSQGPAETPGHSLNEHHAQAAR